MPAVEEDWPERLWSEVREAREGSHTWKEAPLEEIGQGEYRDSELPSLYGEQGTEDTEDSREETLKGMPFM